MIADHNSRVYGTSLVPIERFHIPGVILGADVKPDVVDTVASLQQTGDDPPLVDKAIAHSLFAQQAYSDLLYHLPTGRPGHL